MRMNRLAVLAVLAALGLACGAAAAPASTPIATADPAFVVVGAYDPLRDPARDLQAAIAIAGPAHRRILLEVGGDWCPWCHTMDAFFNAHADLMALRNQSYVLVKVNFSQGNENKAFLGQYPAIPGYPHIFILDSAGKLLHSEDTSELEQGDSYNLERFKAFLQKWAG